MRNDIQFTDNSVLISTMKFFRCSGVLWSGRPYNYHAFFWWTCHIGHAAENFFTNLYTFFNQMLIFLNHAVHFYWSTLQRHKTLKKKVSANKNWKLQFITEVYKSISPLGTDMDIWNLAYPTHNFWCHYIVYQLLNLE